MGILTAIFYGGKGVLAELFGFFKTPIGQIAAAMIGLLIFAAVVDSRARRSEAAKCEAQSLRAELAKQSLELSVAKATAEFAQRERVRLSGEITELNRRADAYEQELAKRPDPACRIRPADLNRLPDNRRGR